MDVIKSLALQILKTSLCYILWESCNEQFSKQKEVKLSHFSSYLFLALLSHFAFILQKPYLC